MHVILVNDARYYASSGRIDFVWTEKTQSYQLTFVDEEYGTIFVDIELVKGIEKV